METIDELAEFYEEDVKTLCESVQKPGGTIVDLNYANQRIANPENLIPEISEKHLKLACYVSRIY